jgi:hypothetical protein
MGALCLLHAHITVQCTVHVYFVYANEMNLSTYAYLYGIYYNTNLPHNSMYIFLSRHTRCSYGLVYSIQKW